MAHKYSEEPLPLKAHRLRNELRIWSLLIWQFGRLFGFKGVALCKCRCIEKAFLSKLIQKSDS